MKSQKKKKKNGNKIFSELKNFGTQSMSLSDNVRMYLMSVSDNISVR